MVAADEEGAEDALELLADFACPKAGDKGVNAQLATMSASVAFLICVMMTLFMVVIVVFVLFGLRR